TREPATDPVADTAPTPPPGTLPRRVRQASIAPQLKESQSREPVTELAPDDRDPDEVRSRMASLQRGWQRGRQDNAAAEAPVTQEASETPETPEAPDPPVTSAAPEEAATPEASAPDRTTPEGDGR
ncbi:histidine kinase, partial [Streptomyces sp. E11-3]